MHWSVKNRFSSHHFNVSVIDIDECSTGNGGCAQTCHNTVGSHYCSCGAGYLIASNNHGCNGK